MSSFFNARMLSCVTVWLPNVFRKGFCAELWPSPPLPPPPPPPPSQIMEHILYGTEASHWLRIVHRPTTFSCASSRCVPNSLVLLFYVLSRPGFTYNPTGTISIPFIIPTGVIALSESELTSVQGQSTCDEILKDGLSFVCDQCNKIFKTLGWYRKHMQAR